MVYRCIRGLGYVDDKSLERLSVLFPRLGSVELRLCSVTDDGLARFCRHNQRDGGLTRLVLDHPGDVSDSALTTLADHSPSLVHLTLAHCPRVSNAGLRSVLAAVHILDYAQTVQEFSRSDMFHTSRRIFSEYFIIAYFQLFFRVVFTVVSGFCGLRPILIGVFPLDPTGDPRPCLLYHHSQCLK